MKFTGIVLRTDVPTPSGRIYPAAVVAEAVKNYQADIKAKRAIGYCGEGRSLEDASHLVTKLDIKDSNVHVEVKPLENSLGQLMIDMLQNNSGGFKMRCQIKQEGVMVAECKLLSIDFVA